jgi:hypothetical protein
LLREHGAATSALQTSTTELANALGAVIDTVACRQFDAEIERLDNRLAALRQARNRGMTRSPWTEVVERLREDPLNADLTVEVADTPEPPDPPPAPLVIHIAPQTIRTAIPISEGGGSSEPMDAAEFYRQERLRRMAEQEPYAVREAAALAQARKHIIR